MSAPIQLKGIKKNFGDHPVLQGVDLTIPQGSIFGFVGENGAGKTTTMKLILGLLAPDHGEVTIFGDKVHYGDSATNRKLGYLPDVPQFYSYLTAREYLRLCGDVAGVEKAVIPSRIDQLLAEVGLPDTKRRIAGYSRGMKQRLGLAQALLTDPKILICDEPTSALDPLGRREILSILANSRGKRTVLFSTHILSDVESICDQVAILHQGKIAVAGNLEDLRRQGGHYRYELVLKSAAVAGKLLPKLPPDSQRRGSLITIPAYQDQEKLGGELLRLLTESEIIPLSFRLVEPSLEELFLEVAGS